MPETARPAPAVLSSMPSTSMVRTTSRDFISSVLLVRLRAGVATRVRTRCLTASSSSAVASGRFALSWSMTGCRSGWRSSCLLIHPLLRTSQPIPDRRCAPDARRGLRAALRSRGAGAVRLPRVPDRRPGARRGPAGRHVRARAALAHALRPAARVAEDVAVRDRAQPAARPRAAVGRRGAGRWSAPGRPRQRSTRPTTPSSTATSSSARSRSSARRSARRSRCASAPS